MWRGAIHTSRLVHGPGEGPPKGNKGHWGLLPSFVSLVALLETLGVLSPVWASVSGKKKKKKVLFKLAFIIIFTDSVEVMD